MRTEAEVREKMTYYDGVLEGIRLGDAGRMKPLEKLTPQIWNEALSWVLAKDAPEVVEESIIAVLDKH